MNGMSSLSSTVPGAVKSKIINPTEPPPVSTDCEIKPPSSYLQPLPDPARQLDILSQGNLNQQAEHIQAFIPINLMASLVFIAALGVYS